MFDDNVIELRSIIEKYFKKMDERWEYKESNEIWERFFKEYFLKNNFNVSIYYYDNFINYKINKENILNKRNCENLLGYNRVFNGDGDFVEFFGFYVDIYEDLNFEENCSVYMILYYSEKDKGLVFHTPENGNTMKFKKKFENKDSEFILIKNDKNAYLDFFEIKKDIFRYFFNCKTKYNEDIEELLDAIRILSDNKNIDNLIKGFYKNH